MPAPAKTRLDQALVARGLAETRQKAQALVLAGLVKVNGVVLSKAGHGVSPEDALELSQTNQDVARSAGKLRQAFEQFPLSAQSRVCLDVGSSTGGFTQVLLEQGAEKVIAVDVGAGLMHERIARNPRVVLMERTNARHLQPTPELAPVTLAVTDVSFISLRLILPAMVAACPNLHTLVALIKPQFEVGREEVGKGGIVKNEAAVTRVREELQQFAATLGLTTQHQVPCTVKGAKGNQEWLWVMEKTGQSPVEDFL